jgi:cytochrome c oxidase assembly protein subunit 15
MPPLALVCMFMTASASTPSVSRWVHAWAVLTVCATLPLLVLGAEVTTKQVGMVDDKGFRVPWHMLVVSLQEKGLGFVIEHSHRLAGFIVGTCIIVLAIGLWWREPRGWVRWMGVASLGAVIIQGLLGGFRVQLNALLGKDLALIHGCFAQLVFALLVAVALFTSRGWIMAAVLPATAEAGQLRRWSLVTAALVYFQIILGGMVRHTDFFLGPRLHLVVAFAVVGAVIWLFKLALDLPVRTRSLTNPIVLLGFLVIVQICLGMEAWIGKFVSREWPQLQPLTIHPDLVRSLHFLFGSLVFATSVVVVLQAQRRIARNDKASPVLKPVGRLEGAA